MSLDVTDYSFDSIHFDNYKYSYKNAGKTIHIKKDETFEIHSHKPDVENQHKPRYKWQYITIKQTYKALEDVKIKIFEGFVRFDKDKVVEKNEFL